MPGQVSDGGALNRTGRGLLLMAAATRHSGVNIAGRRLRTSVVIATAKWYDYTAVVLLEPLRDTASIVSLLRTTFVPAGMRLGQRS